jgi:hypothetical protein
MKALLTLLILQFSFLSIQVVRAEDSIFDIIGKENKEQIKSTHSTSGEFYESAELTLIDKKTGKLKSVSVTINRPVTIKEKLVIRLLACWQEDRKRINPDVKSLIELYDVSSSKELEKEFFGWLFAQNPTLSSYNNPAYDITLKRCF